MNAVRTTDALYQTDSYLREFTAQVVTVDPAELLVELDQTAFYPTGGGQPHDTGTLTWKSQTAQVIEVLKGEGGRILHRLAPASVLPTEGETVTGIVDWERRYQLMRTHSALHVLCGVVFRDYGARVTGGNMTPDHARMDFEMDSSEFTPERVAEIERNANAEMQAAHDIRVQILPRDEAFQIPDLIRTKINLLPEGIEQIRTVEIVSLDLQADGGTHVANTLEIGGLKVIGTRSKGKINKRLEVAILPVPAPSPSPTNA